MPLFIVGLLVIVAFIATLFLGSVDIPFSNVADILTGAGGNQAHEYIVLQSRLPSAIAATLGGAALAVAGLLMQTAFRNPLAGPSIMGINAGASLGVAMVMLCLGGSVALGSMQLEGEIAVVAGALVGGLAVMAIIVVLSTFLCDNLMLLIAAILVGYLATSVIMILNYGASSTGVQSYVMWGMGTFQGIPLRRIIPFAIITLIALLLVLPLVKPLDALLLGDDYAVSLGVNIKHVRLMLLVSTGLLASVVTAYCGPVAFIGLAVPHIARFIVRTDIHRRLLPATLLCGAFVALACNIVCVLPASMNLGGVSAQLPLNAVTSLFGVPVILYVLLKR